MRTEVIPFKSAAAAEILNDFRVRRSEHEFVAEVAGEGLLPGAAAPANDGEQKLFIRYHSQLEWQRRRAPFLKRWLQSLRLSYLSVAGLPMLLALAGTRAAWSVNALVRFLLAFVAVSLLQIGAQLWNDFEDHVRGIDLPGNGGGSGVIQRLWIPAIHIKYAAGLCLLLGCLSGAALLALTSGTQLGVLALAGAIGALGAASYSGWPWHYKYLGLGEFIVFFLTGPLLTATTSYLITADLKASAWFAIAGTPLGILTCLRLHVGNVQKIPFHRQASSKTLANSLSFTLAKKLIFWSMLLPYLAIGLLIAFKFLPPRALLVLVSVPILAYEWRLVRMIKSPLDPVLNDIRHTTAYQQLFFGLIYILSLAL